MGAGRACGGGRVSHVEDQGIRTREEIGHSLHPARGAASGHGRGCVLRLFHAGRDGDGEARGQEGHPQGRTSGGPEDRPRRRSGGPGSGQAFGGDQEAPPRGDQRSRGSRKSGGQGTSGRPTRGPRSSISQDNPWSPDSPGRNQAGASASRCHRDTGCRSSSPASPEKAPGARGWRPCTDGGQDPRAFFGGQGSLASGDQDSRAFGENAGGQARRCSHASGRARSQGGRSQTCRFQIHCSPSRGGPAGARRSSDPPSRGRTDDPPWTRRDAPSQPGACPAPDLGRAAPGPAVSRSAAAPAFTAAFESIRARGGAAFRRTRLRRVSPAPARRSCFPRSIGTTLGCSGTGSAPPRNFPTARPASRPGARAPRRATPSAGRASERPRSTQGASPPGPRARTAAQDQARTPSR